MPNPTFSPETHEVLKTAQFSLLGKDGIKSHLAICRFLDSKTNKRVDKKADLYRHFAALCGASPDSVELKTRICEILEELETKRVIRIKKTVVDPSINLEKHEIILESNAYGQFLVEIQQKEKQVGLLNYETAQKALAYLNEHNVCTTKEGLRNCIVTIIQYCWRDCVKSYDDTVDILKRSNPGLEIPPRSVMLDIGAALIAIGCGIFKDARTKSACQRRLTEMAQWKQEKIAITSVQERRETAYKQINKTLTDLQFVYEFFKTTRILDKICGPGLYQEYLDLSNAQSKICGSIKDVINFWSAEKKVIGSSETDKYFKFSIQTKIGWGRVSLMRAAMYLKRKDFQHSGGKQKAEERYTELIKEGFQLKQQKEFQFASKPKPVSAATAITESMIPKDKKGCWVSTILNIPTDSPDSEYVIQVARSLPDNVLSKVQKRNLISSSGKERIRKVLAKWLVNEKYYVPLSRKCELNNHTMSSAINYILLNKYGLGKIVFPSRQMKAQAIHRLEQVRSEAAKFTRTNKVQQEEAPLSAKFVTPPTVLQIPKKSSYVLVRDQQVVAFANDAAEANDFLKEVPGTEVYRKCKLVEKKVFQVEDL